MVCFNRAASVPLSASLSSIMAAIAPLDLTRGRLLHAAVRVNDFCRPVRVNHHYAVAVQQGPALALFEPVEKPNTRAGVR